MAGEDIVVKIGADDSSFRSTVGKLKSDLSSGAGGFSDFGKSAQTANDKINEIATNGLPRIRYALYDVAATTRIASQALKDFSASAINSAMEYETAFTAVERTSQVSGQAAEDLKNQLMDLGEQIPLTFQEISGIATLGAQLGISSDKLTQFTDTVAKFSSVTNVTSEQAAQSFGALGQLLGFTADEYEKFGAAVAYAGTKSVATETQILSVATQIGGIAGAAKISAQDVVGLSTAIASLQIPAEQARGALTRTFQEINRAVALGGPELQNFANLMGLTTDEAANLAKTDMSGFFDRFIASMAGLNPQQMTQALDALGLSELRVTNTLTRLASNFDLVQQSQANATAAYADGAFLTESFAQRADDLAAKLQILQNTFTNLSAQIASQLIPIITPLLDGLAQIGRGLQVMAASEFGRVFFAIGLGVAALTAILFGGLAAVLTLLGGYFAMKTALVGLINAGVLPADLAFTKFFGSLLGVNVQSIVTKTRIDALTASFMSGAIGIQAYIAQMTVLTAAETAAAAAASRLKWALISTGIGAIAVGLGTLAAAFFMANDAEAESAAVTDQLAASQQEAINTSDAFGMELGNVGDSASGAAEKLRTLVDYANDLSAVFSRAFEIKFNGQSTLDSITSSWRTMANGIADARKEMKALNADISGLNSDKALQEYYLSVANAYGDTAAAAKAQAKLDDINAKLADKNDALAKAQDKVNGSLVGNSEAAIENRSSLQGLVKKYQDHLKALAASGMGQEELNAATRAAKADFIAQATQLGYNTNELDIYASAFDDVSTIISNLPRNVNIEFNGDAALTALEEFAAKAREAAGATDGTGGGIGPSGFGGVEDPFASMKKNQPGSNWWDDMWAGWNGMWGDISTNWQNFWKDADKNWAGMWSDFGAGWNGMWGDFAAGWNGMWSDFGNGLAGLWNDISTNVTNALKPLWDVLTFPARLMGAIAQDLHLAEVWNDFVKNFNAAVTDIIDGWNGMWSDFGKNVAKFWGDMVTGFNTTMESLIPGWGQFWTNAGLIIQATWTNLVNGFTQAVGAIAAGWNAFWGAAGLVIAARWNQMVTDFTTKFNTIIGGWNSFWSSVGTNISNIWNTFRNGFSSAIGWIESTWNSLWGRLGNFISTTINNAMRQFQRAMPATFNVLKPIINWAFGTKFAEGGYVSGAGSSTSDSIPARLSNGEYVMRADSVQKYGRSFFDNLNQMKTPQYFSGGPVGNTGNSGGIVSLSPEDRALLRSVGGSGQIVLYADNEAIARSANAGNRNIVAAGGRP